MTFSEHILNKNKALSRVNYSFELSYPANYYDQNTIYMFNVCFEIIKFFIENPNRNIISDYHTVDILEQFFNNIEFNFIQIFRDHYYLHINITNNNGLPVQDDIRKTWNFEYRIIENEMKIIINHASCDPPEDYINGD